MNINCIIMNKKILGLLLAAGVLSVTACSLNERLVLPDAGGEEIEVTFSLSTEGEMVSSKADKAWTISDGSQIDKLVYAVYIEDEDAPTGFHLLKQYGSATLEEGVVGLGQTVLITDQLTKEEGQPITLRLMRGRQYVIGFWAQNSACTAYKTDDLEKVVVDYTAGTGDAPNNDEVRDAFSKVYKFTATVGVTEYVKLERAMAQINVGTAGWDYNAEVAYGNNYAYSKIVMKGLYDQLNVLTGEVSKTEAVRSGSDDKEITYTWAKLPAYIRSPYPASEDTPSSEEFAKWLTDQDNNDEFLKVDLIPDKDYLPYLESAPEDGTKIATETFKYLSMCYVLAPTYDPESADSDGPAKGGTTITHVSFYLSETAAGGVYDKNGEEEEASHPLFEISTVPIQRNWRTNILGGTHGKETTLFGNREFAMYIDIRPAYTDDHLYGMNGGSGVAQE